MTTKATAAVIHKADEPFKFETIELDDLKSDEILVRIEASGVCHTDMIAQNITPLPAVLGHEGMGVVEAIGSKVIRIKPGDRVIISYPFCGTCPTCLEGRAYICDYSFPLSFGGARLDQSKSITLNGEKISGAFFQQSSFATHSITLERDAVPVKGDFSPEMLAAIPCGIQTGAGAILNSLKVGAGDGLAIFGTGAVGLSAVMAGHLSGANPIIAVDIVEKRLQMALELGATHTINAKDGETALRIREISTRGLKFSLETSSNPQSFKDALDCLCMGGVCGFVIPHEPLENNEPFIPQIVLSKGASLVGILLGSAIPNIFLPKLIELNKKGLFPYDRLITTYDFSDINKAFKDSKAGKSIKPVLIM